MNDHSPKNYTAALLLVLLGGFFGLHRFYVGKVATGILYLITFAFFGLGWILDIILVAAGSFTDKSGRFVKPGVQTSNTAPAPPPGEAAVASNLPSQSSSPSSTGDPTPITNGAVTPSSSGGPPRLEQTTPNDSQAQKPQPLPWWGWALIVVGSLALISFVFGGDDSEVTPEASENAPQQVDEPEPEPEFSDAALRMTVTDNTSDGIPEDFEVWIKGTGSWFYSQNSLIEEGGPFPVEEPSSFFIYPNGRDATVGADAFGEVQELEIRVPVEVPSDVIPGSPRDMIYIDVYDSEIIVSGTSIADSEIVLGRPQPDEPQEVQAEPESEGEESACLDAWKAEKAAVDAGTLDDATLVATAYDCPDLETWEEMRAQVNYGTSPNLITAVCAIEPDSPVCRDANS